MKKIYRNLSMCVVTILMLVAAGCGNDSKLKEAKLENQNSEPVVVFPSDKPSLIFLFTTAG
ncbi:hypothetical protein IHV10_03990 [Fictibacillus sp. 5RED26]|uniref:hypothetical protein n=1 Tax=unclassified Fictibacillus TaxID=2644029 RepID=UPI0018CF509E|nr:MULTISPECIES: hypothetical protein [unclassified Fictibacillus]MBH0155514.1 hypothetical protein [Fictibacillus sp. 5RED26]MBH0164691.1 hypothetical protein [Fictibacillus sp. 7GRE50]MBH0172708.1 hypothetical protein [Fictibacillus sp. 23RED33]